MRKFPSINSLREKHKKFEQEHSGGQSSIFYPYYELKIGASSRVRFLPNLVDDDSLVFGFLKQKFIHKFEVNGEPKAVPCLEMYGEACPACETSRKYYKAGDKDQGKKYWRKKGYLAQILILEDGIEHTDGEEDFVGQVKPINLGFQLYNIISDAIMEGELDEPPYAYEGGTDFVIKRTQQGEYATYIIGSKFVKKPTDLDAETIDGIEGQLTDLNTLIPAKPEYNLVKKLVKASIEGISVDDDEGEEEEEEEKTAVRTRVVKSGSKASKSKDDDEEAPWSGSDDDDDADILDAEEKILADIRARRKAG